MHLEPLRPHSCCAAEDAASPESGRAFTDAPAVAASGSSARRFALGVSWVAAGTFAVQALVLLSSIATARYIGPESFGIVGMASVVVTFVSTVTDLGLSPAIASGRLAKRETLWAAHWTVTAVGIVAGALTFLVAPLVASFFETTAVVQILRVQSLLFVGAAFGVVPQAMLQQRGQFARLTALKVAVQALALALVVAALSRGAGIWALIVPNVLSTAATGPLAWVLAREWPRLRGDGTDLRKFAVESFHMTGFTVFNYFARNADNAIIGRLNGAQALGEYAFAYNFLTRPLQLLSHSLTPVLMPTFGSAAGDTSRLSGLVVRVVLVAVRIGAPVTIGGAATAHLFVPVIFGPRWAAASPLVALLMIIGALQLVGPIFGAVAMATGRSGFFLRWGVWTGVVTIAAFFIGARAGAALGVAIAYLLYNVAMVATMYRIARRGFGLPLSGLLPGLARIARDVSIMTACVLGAEGMLSGTFPPWVRLCVEVLTGATTYVVAVRLLAPADAAAILGLLPSRVRGLGARVLLLDPGST